MNSLSLIEDYLASGGSCYCSFVLNDTRYISDIFLNHNTDTCKDICCYIQNIEDYSFYYHGPHYPCFPKDITTVGDKNHYGHISVSNLEQH